MALASCGIFQGAAPEDFEPLLPSVSRRQYGERQHLWHAGDPANWMYVLLLGEVVVSRIGPNGEQYVIEVYVRGDAMGQLPFFDDHPVRFTDAVAARPTECFVAPRDAVLALLRERPQLTARMLAAYSRWIRSRDMRTSEAAYRNLAGRVACKLVELASRYGERGPDGIHIPIRITQETLAGMLGASRENVNRALARLARQGEVRRRRSVLVIPDLEDLAERYSDFEESREGFAFRAFGALGAGRPESSR